MCIRDSDRQLLVGLTGSDGVEVYDVTGKEPRLTKKIPTGKGAHAFRAAGDGRHVYVSNRVANTISKIDLQTMQEMCIRDSGNTLDIGAQAAAGRADPAMATVEAKHRPTNTRG